MTTLTSCRDRTLCVELRAELCLVRRLPCLVRGSGPLMVRSEVTEVRVVATDSDRLGFLTLNIK